ncbi:MAG TPA: DNA lyase [Ignavibacteria bacterium]
MKYKNDQITHLKKEYRLKKIEIKNKLNEFKNVKESDYFYELVYCLFTPQSSAKNCFIVVKEMEKRDYFTKPFPLKHILHQKNGIYIRFHNNKEKYVIDAHKKFNDILNKIYEIKEPFELREWLVNNIKGLSYKEATHFLRNIGKNKNLAILDRHILNNLLKYGIINELPKSINKKKYYEIEKLFQNFAKTIRIDINELDLLFWSFGTGIILK